MPTKACSLAPEHSRGIGSTTRIVNEVRTGTASGKGDRRETSQQGWLKLYSDNKYYGLAQGIIDNPAAAFGDAAYPGYRTFNTITDEDHDGNG